MGIFSSSNSWTAKAQGGGREKVCTITRSKALTQQVNMKDRHRARNRKAGVTTKQKQTLMGYVEEQKKIQQRAAADAKREKQDLVRERRVAEGQKRAARAQASREAKVQKKIAIANAAAKKDAKRDAAAARKAAKAERARGRGH